MEKEKKSLVEKFKGLSKKNKIVLVTTIIAIAIIVIILTTISIINNIEENRRKEIEEGNKRMVPNLVGMTYKEAKEEIEKLDLIVYTLEKSPENEDIVSTQDPPAETIISKGDTVKLTLKTPITIKSSTSLTGATFKKTWSELKKETDNLFEEKYSQDIHISKGEKVEKTDKSQTDTEYIIFMFYTYSAYNSNEKAYISVNVDDNTDNIIGITYSYMGDVDENSLLIYLQVLDLVSDNLSSKFSEYFKQLSNAQEQGNDINDPDILSYYKDNVYIWSNQYNNQTSIVTMAAEDSEVEYHRQYGKWKKDGNNNNNNNTTETNSSEVAGIEQMIGFLNSYYDLNFNPTDEQMQEIIEFSNTTDEFNNDTLMEFILQKGWTVSGTGTVDNSSGTTSNSNNSSSNNNNTNKNSNDSNTSTYKEIKATLSINIKDLINNSTDPEVETILQSNTLQVSIFVEESEEKSEYLMYHGGIDSIPNTITQEFTFDITNKNSIKSNVRIVIDNTSTMIRESTLYDKSITFDKTGIYTIK